MKLRNLVLQWSIIAVIFSIPALAKEGAGMNAAEALHRLMAGNARYAAGKATRPDQTVARRNSLAQGQKPFAIIVSCSDSRVPPEIVFDQGLGDLFVIRVAGNVVDDHALGSIEYAAEHLGVRLVLVLGHEKCGAVSAAVEGGETTGHVSSIVEAIKPAIEKVGNAPGDRVDLVVRANALDVAEAIRSSKPILDHLSSGGELTVSAARYDLNSGRVEILK